MTFRERVKAVARFLRHVSDPALTDEEARKLLNEARRAVGRKPV